MTILIFQRSLGKCITAVLPIYQINLKSLQVSRQPNLKCLKTITVIHLKKCNRIISALFQETCLSYLILPFLLSFAHWFWVSKSVRIHTDLPWACRWFINRHELFQTISSAVEMFQTDETLIYHWGNVLNHVFLLSYVKYLPIMLRKLISFHRNFSSSTVFIFPGRFFSSQVIFRQ